MPDLRSFVTALLGAALASGCAAPPRVAADPGTPPDVLLAAMRDAARYPVPLLPPLYTLDGSWQVGEFGRVVAIDDPMIAVRLDETDRRDAYFHCVVRISDGSRIKGDGIVVEKVGELLVCRYFECPYGSHRALRLGDEASIDRPTTETLRRSIVAGTAEWAPAAPTVVPASSTDG